jgi:hypothetical protein
MKFYVVFQNQTFKQEHDEGILWAPLRDASGGSPKFHWSNMLKLKKNDVVFSIVKNSIKARGIVIEEAIVSDNPFRNELWGREGWLVEIDYNFSINDVQIMNHINDIRPLLPVKYSPFRKDNGYGNQGYLYEISNELGEYLDNLVSDVYIDSDFDSVFEIDIDTAEIISSLFEEEGFKEAEITLVEVEPPILSNKPKAKIQKVIGKKTDFIKKARRDAAKGQLAEELVLNYEKQNLIDAGYPELAKKVKWVAKKADGYGYDVLSYNIDGSKKYIEVKSTSLSKTNPFDITTNEVKTSIEFKKNYWIYRVYYIESNKPKFYKINGSVEEVFELVPTSYKAYFKE